MSARRRFAVAFPPLVACGDDEAAEEARCHVAATYASDGTSTAVGDDRTTTLTSLSFSAQIAPEGGSGVAPRYL